MIHKTSDILKKFRAQSPVAGIQKFEFETQHPTTLLTEH